MPPFLRELLQDLRYTLRQLRNAPVYALTAVLTLALGLGAATAMLAIVDSVLIRPVALPHAERLVDLRQRIDGKPDGNFIAQDLSRLQAVKAFESVAAVSPNASPVTTRSGSRVDLRILVSADFFRVAGVQPHLGRPLTAADAHAPVAVVNDQFWQERLHGDPRVLGSTIKVKDRPVTIVGVLPHGFALPQGIQGAMVYTPLSYDAKGLDEFSFDNVALLARLKPGVTLAAALAEAKAVHARGKAVHGEGRGELLLRPYRELLVEDERPALLAVLGACFLLLLIACANSANLQIARGVSRAGEMNVRAALGASRGRLVRQIATESITVSSLGAALGLGFAYGAVGLVRTTYASTFPRFNELAVNPRIFVACAILAVLAGLLAAIAPAWNAARNASSVQASLTTRVTQRSRLSSTLVAAEIALTCVLLLTAGLFIRTYLALAHAPFGFDPKHVTEMTLMPNIANQSPQSLKQSQERLLTKLGSLPGVQAATSETSLPYSQFTLTYTSDFHFVGEPGRKGQHTILSVINPGFHRTLGMDVRKGRNFVAGDSEGAQPVCLVSEAFVRVFLHGRNALGRTIAFAGENQPKPDPFFSVPRIIVGVMPDEVAYRSSPTLYVPLSQFSAASSNAGFMFGIAPQFAVRSSLPQATIERELRAALRETASNMAEMEMGPLSGNIQTALTKQKLALRLTTGFGLLALVLAGVGIYGVLASSVAQRTREIGIRMALGSSRKRAMFLVLKQAAAMVLLGLAAGLLCAWPAGRAVKAFLFGVTPLDPLTLGLTTAVLLLVCAVAAAVPAWRATQVDPVVALRAE